MTLQETERFYRLMADHQSSRRREADDEARMLWDHTLNLLKAIRECDGSATAMDALKSQGNGIAVELRTHLEGKGARAA